MRPSIVVTLALAIPSTSRAQPAEEDKAKPEETEWTAKGEAGLVASTGNARMVTVTGSANALRKDEHNKVELTATGTYARATTRTATDADGDGAIAANELDEATSVSAENAAVKLRYDRYLTAMDAVFAAGLAGFDTPAGKDFTGGLQVGYSRALYKQENHEALAELGYDLTYVSLTAGDTQTIHSARAFVGYKGKIKKETALEASAEGIFNGNKVTYGTREASAFEAARLTSMVGVTTALSGKLSLNASFTVKYDNFPAPLGAIGGVPFAPGFEPTAEELDTITKISVIMKFL